MIIGQAPSFPAFPPAHLLSLCSGSGIAMDNFLLHDNWFSQMEVHKCIDATFEEGNTRVRRIWITNIFNS